MQSPRAVPRNGHQFDELHRRRVSRLLVEEIPERRLRLEHHRRGALREDIGARLQHLHHRFARAVAAPQCPRRDGRVRRKGVNVHGRVRRRECAEVRGRRSIRKQPDGRHERVAPRQIRVGAAERAEERRRAQLRFRAAGHIARAVAQLARLFEEQAILDQGSARGEPRSERIEPELEQLGPRVPDRRDDAVHLRAPLVRGPRRLNHDEARRKPAVFDAVRVRQHGHRIDRIIWKRDVRDRGCRVHERARAELNARLIRTSALDVHAGRRRHHARQHAGGALKTRARYELVELPAGHRFLWRERAACRQDFTRRDDGDRLGGERELERDARGSTAGHDDRGVRRREAAQRCGHAIRPGRQPHDDEAAVAVTGPLRRHAGGAVAHDDFRAGKRAAALLRGHGALDGAGRRRLLNAGQGRRRGAEDRQERRVQHGHRWRSRDYRGSRISSMDGTSSVSVEGGRALSLGDAARLAARLRAELGRAIIGQQGVVQEILTAFFAGGHVLLRGVPGLAKTLLIKTLAQAVHLKFSRIQFTPDLMPSDIIGTEVIEEDRATGHRTIRFIPGPVFANVILADEINRTPPKTQAALLEAMQEYQVTVNGVRYTLERPLFVLATQNPIEQEGTYPLPEAQLDRFMFNTVIEYPSSAEEHRILASTTSDEEPVITPVVTGAEIEAMRHLVRDVPAASNVIDYALRIVRASRPAGGAADGVPEAVRQFVKWGAGPRAGQALVLGANARALVDGRSVAAPDDVRAVALPVLRHRILLNFQAEADSVDADQIVGRLLEAVPAP